MRISMAVNIGDQAPKFELVDGDLKFRSPSTSSNFGA